MRLLLGSCNYFGANSDRGAASLYSSQLDPLSRIAAVNASLISLYRHFGPNRHGEHPSRPLPGDEARDRQLDIVILQIPGRGLLDEIGVDPSCYEVAYADVPPMMLCFEAQRILRERLGAYDYYRVI